MAPFFFTTGVPTFLQAAYIVAISIYSLTVVQFLNRSYGYISFGAVFICLNLIYLSLFVFSHSAGAAGFAKARGVGAFGFDYRLFWMITFQVLCIPLIFIFASRFKNRKKIQVILRSKTPFFVLFGCLCLYVLVYLVLVKPGIYYALLGDFGTAKAKRIEAVLGDTAQSSGVPYIFNYKNLVVWILQTMVLGFIYQSNEKIKVTSLTFLFLFLSFINFSKGSLVVSLLALFTLYSFKNEKASIIRMLIFGAIGFAVLVFYVFFFSESNIMLANAFKAMLTRFYNNSSSAYLQINLFSHSIPHFLTIQDWGIVGDLFGLEPKIPKELVYQEFYSGRGQGGSSFASDSYLAFGWGFLLLTPILLTPILAFDYLLAVTESSRDIGSSWFIGGLVFLGTIVTANIQSTPFSVLNIFTFFRLEYYLYMAIFFAFLKFKIYR